jgi:hypothetical protein
MSKKRNVVITAGGLHFQIKNVPDESNLDTLLNAFVALDLISDWDCDDTYEDTVNFEDC